MRVPILSLVVSCLLSATAFAAPVELFFDDFNDNTAGPNRVPIGWNVSNGTVDIVGPGYFPSICSADGEECIDLDGSTSNAGLMQTAGSFALARNGVFTLSFDYSWNYFNQRFGNTMTYGVGGFTQTLTIPGTRTRPTTSVPYTPLSFSFRGDGSSGGIFFDHEGRDNGGIVVDNVRLTAVYDAVTAPVPLPAGLPLLLLGLGSLTALRRKTLH